MKKLHLSVHDVSPAHSSTLRNIHSTLESLGIVRYSMLVVPDHHGKWPLEDFPEFCGWLRQQADNGVEIVLHGFYHEGDNEGLSVADRFRSRLFTRNEGEFLGLDEEAAEKLLKAGRETLKKVLDIEVNSFVAPGWLYSKGTSEALRKTGFTFTENRWRIWDPAAGKTIVRAPVVNFAGGSRLKRSLAAFWVKISGIVLAGSRTARFVIHPCDFENDSVKKEVIKRLKLYIRRRRTPVSYKELRPVP